MADVRKVTCRVTDRRHNPCTGEAVDPDGEILICSKHLARVLELAGHLPGISIAITAP